MSIREANVNDIAGIARIHKGRFPRQFVGRLPRSLIAKFYASQLARSILLVHVGKSGVDGFVHGGLSSLMAAGRKEFFLTNMGRCFWSMAIRPPLCWSAVKSLTGWRFRNRQSREAPPDCWLRCLAVDRAVEGTGIGAVLVEAFEYAIRVTHAREYGLSVNKSNRRAIQFYEKMGFEVERETEKSFCYRKRLVREASK